MFVKIVKDKCHFAVVPDKLVTVVDKLIFCSVFNLRVNVYYSFQVKNIA